MANTLRFKRGLVSGIPTAALGEPLFTTDTFDLYIGNGTTNTRFQKYIASGTTSQLLRGDGSLLTMPIVLTSPANGEVLKYNGTNWVNSSDAGVTGSGTAGQVTYWGSSSTITGNNNLFWDASNSRLGIGTTTPNNILSVVQSTSGNIAYFGHSFANSSSLNALILLQSGTIPQSGSDVTGEAGLVFNHAYGTLGVNGNSNGGYIKSIRENPFATTSQVNTALVFGTSSANTDSEHMRLTSRGNLGLNVQPNAWASGYTALQIENTALMADADKIWIYANGYFDGSANKYIQNGFASRYNQDSGSHFWQTAASGSAGGNITFSTPMTLNASGRLILGSTSDNGLRFQVTGDGYFSQYILVGTTTARANITTDVNLNVQNGLGIVNSGTTYGQGYQYIRLMNSAGSYAGSISHTASTGIGIYSASDLLFGSSSATNMRLDASGNLGLGVVPSAWASGWKTLQIGALTSIADGFGNTRIYNNVYNNGSDIYLTTAAATAYTQTGGQHIWYNAPSGTAGNAITFTNAMTLDASGNLGIGVTNPSGKFHLKDNNSAFLLQEFSNGASIFLDGVDGDFVGSDYFNIFANSNTYLGLGGYGGGTTPLNVFNTGNVGIGTTTDATYKLDVNGTMRVSGASTFSSSVTADLYNSSRTSLYLLRDATASGYGIFKNNTTEIGIAANGSVALNITSTGAATFSSTITSGGDITITKSTLAQLNVTDTSNTSSTQSYIRANAGTTLAEFGAYGQTKTPYKIVGSGDMYLYKSPTAGDISILNDQSNGSIKMAAGGSSTAHLTIASTGAATFSSSVTAGGDVTVPYLNTDNFIGIRFSATYYNGFVLNGGNRSTGIVSRSNDATDYIWFGTNDATERMRITNGGNVGIAMTPSYKLDVTGEARVSNAIAIGTTPDTNKPFKILKNINGTVGINFENTSTGSSAFSAIQMGTDVSGGTKFTNIVYSSSGVAQSGVYYPDGTSIINIGTGGLNFYSQGAPIRMFNGGGNGVLKWEMVNDSFINHYTGTAPTTSATDGYRQYSADVTAGNAAPHFRTENGAVIKLYQETTAVGNSTISVGGGNAVLDDTEFDGYTLRQIVKALRNQGILA